jgi:hypothetical protein
MAQTPPSLPQQILAQNIQALLDRDFKGPKRGQIGRFCGKHKAIALSKMQRAVAEGAVNLSTVEELAKAFKLQPYQLFIPRLNVNEPQIAIERRYYSMAREVAQGIAREPD